MKELSAKDKAFLKEKQKLLKQISEKREEITRLHAELEELKKEREQLRADLENFERYKNIDNEKLREHVANTEKITAFLRLCDYVNTF
jgi:molecular chaperone GrpE (heat shock protein)